MDRYLPDLCVMTAQTRTGVFTLWLIRPLLTLKMGGALLKLHEVTKLYQLEGVTKLIGGPEQCQSSTGLRRRLDSLNENTCVVRLYSRSHSCYIVKSPLIPVTVCLFFYECSFSPNDKE